MTKKSRDRRVFNRLQKWYTRFLFLQKPYTYTQVMLNADLYMKQKAREYFSKYPKPMPKLTYYPKT
jgi:hypothetical protein